jgi:uncharacterized protein
MEQKIILIHGCCTKEEFSDELSRPNGHWFPWLKQQLVDRGIRAYVPEMPTPYAPRFEEWAQVIDGLEIDENTSLVGHSCGGGFLLRWIQERHCPVNKVILVAPWLDPIKNRGNFLTINIDSVIQELTQKVFIIYSDNDPVAGVRESVEITTKALPNVQLRQIIGYGHFTESEMKMREFPELLDMLIS